MRGLRSVNRTKSRQPRPVDVYIRARPLCAPRHAGPRENRRAKFRIHVIGHHRWFRGIYSGHGIVGVFPRISPTPAGRLEKKTSMIEVDRVSAAPGTSTKVSRIEGVRSAGEILRNSVVFSETGVVGSRFIMVILSSFPCLSKREQRYDKVSH